MSKYTPAISCETIGGIISARDIATGIYSSVLKSAPLAGKELKRLLKAYGKNSGILATATAIPVLMQHTMALEMFECTGMASESASLRLQAEILRLAESRIGDSESGRGLINNIRSILDTIKTASARGENPYGCVADLLFVALGISDHPRRPFPSRGTWHEYWQHSFLNNSHIARSFLCTLEETGEGWLRKVTWSYQPVDWEKPVNVVFILPCPPSESVFRNNLTVLAAVRLANGHWITRPTIDGSNGKVKAEPGAELPAEKMPMSIIDPILAKALQNKLEKHAGNARYVEMLFTAMDQLNFDLVMGPDLFPDTTREGEVSALNAARKTVLAEAKLGDILLTRHSGVELSRLIAAIDQGSWSHMLVVLDNKKVVDAQPEGVIEADIGSYLTGTHRFALCRPFAPTVPPPHFERWAAETMRREQESSMGKPYWWGGAVRAALTSWLRLKVSSESHATPNAVAFRGDLKPIVVW